MSRGREVAATRIAVGTRDARARSIGPAVLRGGVQRSAALLGALLALALSAGCARLGPAAPPGPAVQPSAPASQTSARPRVARLGATLSLTGSASAFGLAQQRGIQLAVDEVNETRALGDVRLTVAFADDASDRTQSVAQFQKLIYEDRVLALLGPSTTATSIAADALAQQAGVPVLSLAGGSGGVAQLGDFVFVGALSETQIAPPVVAAVRAKAGRPIEQAAIVYTTDEMATRAQFDTFKNALAAAGVPLVSEVGISRTDTELTQTVAAILAANPSVVCVSAPPAVAARVVVELRQQASADLPIIGGGSFATAAFLKEAGLSAENTWVGTAWSVDSPWPRSRQFAAAYQARFGLPPDQPAAIAYSSVWVMADALKRTRDPSSMDRRKALRDNLAMIRNLDTPLGLFTYGPAGEASYTPIVRVVQQGVPRVVVP